MKKQTYIYLAIGLALVLLFGVKQCQLNKERDKNQIANVKLSALNDSVYYYQAKDSTLTAKIISVQVESDNRKEALEAAGFETKKLLRENDIKWRDINFALSAQIQAQGSGQTTLHDTTIVTKTDTLKSANFSIKEKHLKFNASIIDKDVKYNYTYQTGINLISEKKGKSFIVSAYLEDKGATITTANSITINPKKKRLFWRILEDGAAFALGFFLAK